MKPGTGDPTVAFDPREPKADDLTEYIFRTCAGNTLSLNVAAPSDVSTEYLTQLGKHDIYYNVVNQAAPPRKAPELSRAISVQDTTPPTIVICPQADGTVCGAPQDTVCPKPSDISQNAGIEMVYDASVEISEDDLGKLTEDGGKDPGAAACDALDRALGTVDLDRRQIKADWSTVATMLAAHQVGTAKVTYTIKDGQGNEGSVSRPVAIKDMTKPKITVTGDGTAESTALQREAILKRTPYTDAGATVDDIVDGDITNSLVWLHVPPVFKKSAA